MVFEFLLDTVAALWGPPERAMGAVWRRFKHRAWPLRTVGVLLCTLVALGSFAFWAAILAIPLIGGWLLVQEIV